MDKHHILVVDDNHINRLFFESSLKKLGTVVKTADDGYQALELCHKHKFNLILMDIRMNGMDGIETAASIKSIELNNNTPILAVSAEQFDSSTQPNFTASLLKPISQDQLKLIIESHLSETPEFDQQLALKISHNDSQIVHKLRQMLIDQLPADWKQLKHLEQTCDTQGMKDHLHKMLGSARVCAASLLIKHIESLKDCLDLNQNFVQALEGLNNAIEKTING